MKKVKNLKLSIIKYTQKLYYKLRNPILTFYYNKTLSIYPQLNLQDKIVEFLKPYFDYKVDENSIIQYISSPDKIHDYKELPRATIYSVFKSQNTNNSESIQATLFYLYSEKYLNIHLEKDIKYYKLTPKSRVLLETQKGFVKGYISSKINNFLLRLFWIAGLLHIFKWVGRLFNLVKPSS